MLNLLVRQPFKSNSGITRLEVLVCVTISAVGVTLAISKYNQSVQRNRRVQCQYNLKPIGDSFRSFAADTGGAYPWSATPAQGGVTTPASGSTPSSSNSLFCVFSCVSTELSTRSRSTHIDECGNDSLRSPIFR